MKESCKNPSGGSAKTGKFSQLCASNPSEVSLRSRGSPESYRPSVTRPSAARPAGSRGTQSPRCESTALVTARSGRDGGEQRCAWFRHSLFVVSPFTSSQPGKTPRFATGPFHGSNFRGLSPVPQIFSKVRGPDRATDCGDLEPCLNDCAASGSSGSILHPECKW